MVFHLPETENYLENLLRRIDSPSTASGHLHLGKCLEETEGSTFLPKEKIVRALLDYLSLDQYLSPETLTVLPESPERTFTRYLTHLYWEIYSQSDDEASAHGKATRSLRKIIPKQVIQTLEIIDDIQSGAEGQQLAGLEASFYQGTGGYAIEFSILPEGSTTVKIDLEKTTLANGIHITRTDLMTLILCYVKE